MPDLSTTGAATLSLAAASDGASAQRGAQRCNRDRDGRLARALFFANAGGIASEREDLLRFELLLARVGRWVEREVTRSRGKNRE